MSTNPDYGMALEFLQRFHGVNSLVNVCHKTSDGKMLGRTFDGLHQEAVRESLRRQLAEWGGVDCYFSIAVPAFVDLHKRLATDELASCGHIWTDIDPKDGRDTAECVRLAQSIEPECLVRSGGPSGGAWGFIRLAGQVPVAYKDEIELRNKALAARTHGDVCSDISRIARLPGTINSKYGTLATAEWADLFIAKKLDAYPKAEAPVPVAERPAVPDDIHAQVKKLDWDDINTELHPDDVPELSQAARAVAVLGEVDGKRVTDRSQLLMHFAARALREGATIYQTAGVMANASLPVSGHLWNLPKVVGKKRMSEAQALKQIQKCLIKALKTIHGKQIVPNTINISEGELADTVSALEAKVLEKGIAIYQRGGMLVRAVVVEKPGVQDDGIKREAGSVVLRDVDPNWLRDVVSKVTRFTSVDDRGAVKFLKVPPAVYFTTYKARVGSWRVPRLAGVVAAPTLRADGSILQMPGYDAATELLFAPGGVEFPPVPELPSKADAEAALATLAAPFRLFPYVSAASRSVPIAAILEGLVRHLHVTAPLFLFDAPKAGTGKTLCAQAVGIVVSGCKPPATPQGINQEEDQKQLVSALLAGDRVLLIDNIQHSIDGAFLCMMLTADEVSPRVLGSNDRPVLSTRVLLLGSGNNAQVVGDMCRRVVPCRMDARMERPDSRQFEGDLEAELLAARPALVVAGLTILRAYLAAGRPCPLAKIGSFEGFSLVREALVWLGWADPADTRASVMADDAQQDELVTLHRAWWECFGDKWRRLADVLRHIENNPNDAAARELMNVLLELTNRPVLNRRAIGAALSAKRDNVAAGRVLQMQPDPSNGSQYRVVELDRPEQMRIQGFRGSQGSSKAQES